MHLMKLQELLESSLDDTVRYNLSGRPQRSRRRVELIEEPGAGSFTQQTEMGRWKCFQCLPPLRPGMRVERVSRLGVGMEEGRWR